MKNYRAHPSETRAEKPFELVLMHGWGYDADMWNGLVPFLKRHPVTVLEAGYYGATPIQDLPSSPFIAIGHSAGGLWFLNQDLTYCRAVILINSFSRFFKGADFPFGKAPQILSRMSRRLATAPEEVLRTFRQNFEDRSPFGTPHVARLASGLDFLKSFDARQNAAGNAFKLYCIAAVDDPLITPDMSQACFAEAHHLKWAEGGHILPKTKPHLCARIIDDILQDLQ